MKNLATILAFVFAFTFTTQAQKQKKRSHKRPQLTIEQHTNLAIKKITLDLDLSENQQNKIKPLIAAKMTERKAFMEKRKEARKERKKPTADEVYALKSKVLDNQIAMRNSMKEILNKEQFEKFEKMQKVRKMRTKKMKMKKMQEKRGQKMRRK